MSTDSPSRFQASSWERRVGQRQNLGRRRTDTVEHRRAVIAAVRLRFAVKIGVVVALVAALGATFIAWRADLFSTPIAILVVLAVAVPWAIVHLLSSMSHSSDPFAHVDRRIWLP